MEIDGYRRARLGLIVMPWPAGLEKRRKLRYTARARSARRDAHKHGPNNDLLGRNGATPQFSPDGVGGDEKMRDGNTDIKNTRSIHAQKEERVEKYHGVRVKRNWTKPRGERDGEGRPSKRIHPGSPFVILGTRSVSFVSQFSDISFHVPTSPVACEGQGMSV